MIILVNGPSQCGKDTFYKLARKYLPDVGEYKLSRPMKSAFRSCFDYIPTPMLAALLEEYKDDPMFRGHDTTPRDFQIKMYELLTELFYDGILGYIGVAYMLKIPRKHIIVTDAGRNVEVCAIIEEFGYANVGIVEISRPGKEFGDDNREPLNDNWAVKYRDTINNKYDLELYEVQVKKLLIKWELIDAQ